MKDSDILFEEINRFGPMGKKTAGEPTNDYQSVLSRRNSRIYGSISLSVKDNGIFLSDLERRQAFVERYSWAVPSENDIKTIIKFVKDDKIVEIGSGLGLWAKLLHEYGASIKATDSYDKSWNRKRNNFYPVRKLPYQEALALFGNREVLFLCWPPYKTPLAHHSLKMFKGNKLIYIGENKGCNGDEPFFHLLDTQWKKIKTVDIIQWPLMNDKMFFYVRRVK